MSIRQTRLEHKLEQTRLRAPKVSPAAFMAKVRRLIARRMVADGVVERKDDKPEWSFYFELGEEYRQGKVGANTRSEARSRIKELTGCKTLPTDIIIEKVNADSTRSVGAA